MPEKAELENDIVNALYRGACEPSELKQALESLRRLFGGAAAVLGEVEFGRPGISEPLTVGVLDEGQLHRYPSFATFDPLLSATLLAPAGSVNRSARLLSPEERRRNPFIHEFLRPIGVIDAISSRESLGGGRSGIISILQGIGCPPFDDEDAARLIRMTPHLGRVYQIRRLFRLSRQRDAFLGSIVDRSSAGIIALRADGSTLFVNRTAQLMGEASDGIALGRTGQLITADRNAAKRLAALRADVAQGGPGGVVRIARPSGQRPYVVLVSRLPPGDGLVPGERPGVLIAIHDPARMTVPTEQRIAELLQLPPATTKLVCSILQGEELKHYAERASISMNTVRFHLKVAFERTGARTQAELIRIGLQALNDLGSHFREAEILVDGKSSDSSVSS